MFSFEFNKLAGAFLGACVFAMALGIVAEAIYSNGTPSKPGYELPQAKVEAAAEKPADAVPLPVLLAKADATKGQADTKVCQACHNFEKGAGVKVGPPLYGVVDRPKGSIAGFDYSAGLKAKGGNWTFADLDQFITNPKAYISGTKMGYAGEAEAPKRADIIAYLRTLSDNPAPLPAVAADAAKPATDGKTEAKADDKAAATSSTAAKASVPATTKTPAPPAPVPTAPAPTAAPVAAPLAAAAPEPAASSAPASGDTTALEPPHGADPQYPSEQPAAAAPQPATPEPAASAPPPSDPAALEPPKGADPQYPSEQK